jgi:hypothetical protein
LHCAEQASCFRAGSKEETREALQETEVDSSTGLTSLVRGRRYRGSTQETKSVRALKVASLKLASGMEDTDPLPGMPTALGEFADFSLGWTMAGWKR